MKSSTIRRSTLSKESMEVIENLAKEQEESGLPGEYLRPDEIVNNESSNNGMSQEIDLLWQNFKTSNFNTNSPAMYIAIGIFIGVLGTLLVMFGMKSIPATKTFVDSSKNKPVQEQTLEEQTGVEQGVVNSDTSETANTENVEETANVDTSNMTNYVIQNGDTVESIIKKHYGTYSPDKAEEIMKVNNMESLDRINIDQEILLP